FHVKSVGANPQLAPTTDSAPSPGGGGDAADGSDDDVSTVALAGDDYRAMYEVLARRFRRGLKRQEEREEQKAESDGDAAPDSTDDDKAEWDLPDLFVVDGGKGQLAVA